MVLDNRVEILKEPILDSVLAFEQIRVLLNACLLDFVQDFIMHWFMLT